MPTPILQPGEIEAGAPPAPWLKLPEGSAFANRAARLESLAPGHALADYLRFVAALSLAQHEVYTRMPALTLPRADLLAQRRAHAMPPLDATAQARGTAWRVALQQIVAAVNDAAPPPAQAAIARLQSADDGALEALAATLLRQDCDDFDRAAAPFVAAALQVQARRLASQLGAHQVGRLETASLCPVCGSPPVASTVHVGGEYGLRYLSCALCGSEWNEVRIKCSSCASTKGIAYYGIASGAPAVKAETCDACHSYLKILYLEKDPAADPVADDLASLALDLLLDEQGYQRSGLNYFLIPGPT